MKDNGGKSMLDGYMSKETPDFAHPQGMVYQSVCDVPTDTTLRERAAAAAAKYGGFEAWSETQFNFQEGFGGSTLNPNTDVFYRPEPAPDPIEIPTAQIRSKHRR